jgi:hypothetical protein
MVFHGFPAPAIDVIIAPVYTNHSLDTSYVDGITDAVWHMHVWYSASNLVTMTRITACNQIWNQDYIGVKFD